MTDETQDPRKSLETARDKVQKLRLSNREAIAEVQKLHADAKNRRELRDAENAKVKKAKANWQAAEKEAQAARDKLAEARKALGNVPKSRPPTALQAELERLEWVQQTEALSPKEEKQIGKKIKDLLKILPDAKKASAAFDGIGPLATAMREANEAAKTARREMNEHARKSDEMHQAFLKAIKKADSLSKKITEKFKELDEKRAALDAQLGERRQQQKTLRDKERREMEALKKEQAEFDAKAREKATGLAQKAIEKFKNGGKLSMQDIQAIQAAGLDLSG